MALFPHEEYASFVVIMYLSIRIEMNIRSSVHIFSCLFPLILFVFVMSQPMRTKLRCYTILVYTLILNKESAIHPWKETEAWMMSYSVGLSKYSDLYGDAGWCISSWGKVGAPEESCTRDFYSVLPDLNRNSIFLKPSPSIAPPSSIALPSVLG
jgi:hypothetical protein